MKAIAFGIVVLLTTSFSNASTIEVGNAGFESLVPINQFPLTTFGVWGGNPATIVTAENSIDPVEGTRMLKFTGGDPTSNVWQLVDVSTLPAGTPITFSVAFNRATGSGAIFQMRIAALDHFPPASAADIEGAVIAGVQPLVEQNAWTNASVGAILPAGTVMLGIEIAAFQGTLGYADSIRLVPEPSACALGAFALVGLFAFRRKWRSIRLPNRIEPNNGNSVKGFEA